MKVLPVRAKSSVHSKFRKTLYILAVLSSLIVLCIMIWMLRGSPGAVNNDHDDDDDDEEDDEDDDEDDDNSEDSETDDNVQGSKVSEQEDNERVGNDTHPQKSLKKTTRRTREDEGSRKAKKGNQEDHERDRDLLRTQLERRSKDLSFVRASVLDESTKLKSFNEVHFVSSNKVKKIESGSNSVIVACKQVTDASGLATIPIGRHRLQVSGTIELTPNQLLTLVGANDERRILYRPTDRNNNVRSASSADFVSIDVNEVLHLTGDATNESSVVLLLLNSEPLSGSTTLFEQPRIVRLVEGEVILRLIA